MQVPGVTVIITDSDYCQKGCTKWVHGWVKKGWKTASGSAVKNDDLWKKVIELDPTRIEFRWVKAHAANEHNNYVDKLANNAVDTICGPVTVADKRSNLEKELVVLEKRREAIIAELADCHK